jgi:hypothetical protein
MNGLTKDQIFNLIDAYVPDEGTMITHIGLKGPYIQLKYHIFTEKGIEEIEELVRPDDCINSIQIVTKPKGYTD